MMSLFNQFMSSTFLGIPLIVLALIVPFFLFPNPLTRWLSDRLYMTQILFINNFTRLTLQPLPTTAHHWALMFTSIMIFLLSLNTLGLLPYTFTPTTQLSLNLGIATPLWLATVIIGFRNKPTPTLGHLLPEGTPTLLIPLLIVIETISLFIRPLALGIRLTANLTAGHLLLQLLSSAICSSFGISPFMIPFTFMPLLLLTTLEMAMAVIQAYVFVLLLTLYLQENI